MHAYLIMAHNDFYILERLLKLIDDKRNDIYIHIDKKVKNFDFDYYRNLISKSKIFFIKRIDVRWSDYSQIKCEINLLKSAIKGQYKYYHLISGVDLPLKNQDKMHKFFDMHKENFVVFRNHEGLDESRIERIKYYHLFYKNARSHFNFKVKVSQKMHSICLKFQKLIKLNRVKNINDYRDGANWFSITDELARYVVSKEKQIKKRYKYTYCADEIFLQTLVYNSEYYQNLYCYKDNDYKAIKRAIDWKRGNPYTYTINDFDMLINSKCFFARKFSTKKDKEIIDKIYNYVKGESKNESDKEN